MNIDNRTTEPDLTTDQISENSVVTSKHISKNNINNENNRNY